MSKITLKQILLFVLEVLIPFIAIPLLTDFIKCNGAEAFIIGSCGSIFIAIWTLKDNVASGQSKFELHKTDTRKGFEKIDKKLTILETITRFERELDNVDSLYFKKIILIELQKNLELFKTENQHLYDGYIETTPYSNNTYGVEGIKTTKAEILAVSSVTDYWNRTGFITEYLRVQYELIKDRSVRIKRIFIGTKDRIKDLFSLMRDQKNNGIEVYYIETDSCYCSSDWCTEDFLIQDSTLLVDLKVKSHIPTDDGREIITVKHSLVADKICLFEKMLNSAIPFTSSRLSGVFNK